MLPNVLVIGAMKCATSSICGYLERHPEAFFLQRKEPNFFSVDENWRKGVEAYEDYFFDAGDCAVVGEGSNSYAIVDVYPETPARIASVIPEVKLIYSVRDPRQRIVSAWAQLRAQSPDLYSHDLNEAIRARPEKTIYPSYYWTQVEAYQKYFSRDQLWIGFLEELIDDRSGFFKRLCRYLEINYSPHDQSEGLWANKTEGRQILDKRYTALRNMPGKDLLRSLAPKGLKRAVKKNLTQPTPSTKEMLEILDLPDAVEARLRDEAARLLDYAGKPADYWTS